MLEFFGERRSIGWKLAGFREVEMLDLKVAKLMQKYEQRDKNPSTEGELKRWKTWNALLSCSHLIL